jgi:hypothetical protein
MYPIPSQSESDSDGTGNDDDELKLWKSILPHYILYHNVQT